MFTFRTLARFGFRSTLNSTTRSVPPLGTEVFQVSAPFPASDFDGIFGLGFAGLATPPGHLGFWFAVLWEHGGGRIEFEERR